MIVNRFDHSTCSYNVACFVNECASAKLIHELLGTIVVVTYASNDVKVLM